MKNVFLYGASGFGMEVKDTLNANGVDVEAFIDDNKSIDMRAGKPVTHDYAGLSPVIVSIGDNHTRKVIVEKLQCNDRSIKFATAIHPSAVISPSAVIGEGTVVMAGAIINAEVKIGRHCIINAGASISHECVIGDYAHIAPHVTLCGRVQIGEGTLMGAGSCAIPCVKVGNWATVGSGATVIDDIPDCVTAVGGPARILDRNDGSSTIRKQEL